MQLQVKEQIKTLLSQKGKKQKDLVFKMSELMKSKYSSNSFSHKMKRGTISYNEMLVIAEILGYEVQFVDTHNELI